MLSHSATHALKVRNRRLIQGRLCLARFLCYLQINYHAVLRFFRINDPYRLLALLLLLVIISLPMLIQTPPLLLGELTGMVVGEQVHDKIMYVEIIDRTAPLMATMDGFLDFLFGRSLTGRHLLALFIIFFQASYFGILLINNRAYNENSYVPALVFGLLCFFSFDLLAITPELLASTLLLLALNNLFKEIEFRVDRDSIVLNLGVFIGLASLFVLSYTIFLAGAIIILLVFARSSIRKILLVLVGFALVHGILLTWYYVYGNTAELWNYFYLANIRAYGEPLMNFSGLALLLGVPLSYFVFSLFMLTREARFTKYQSQLFQTIFLWLAVALIQFWMMPARSPHSLYTVIPSLAYFISHYLLLIRRKAISEMMLWLFLIGILVVSTMSRQQQISSINYNNLLAPDSEPDTTITGKRVMVLSQDRSWYKNNAMAGYFLDWDLSRSVIESPDVYNNIILVNEALEADTPDFIIDPENKMGPVLERLPKWKEQYVWQNGRYARR